MDKGGGSVFGMSRGLDRGMSMFGKAAGLDSAFWRGTWRVFGASNGCIMRDVMKEDSVYLPVGNRSVWDRK